jgi:hypothetical protein
MFRDISVNSVDGLPAFSGWRGTALLFYTIPRRLPPASRTLPSTISGQGFLFRAADAFAVIARFIAPCGAFAAGFLDHDLV